MDYFISDLHLSADGSAAARAIAQHWQRFIDQHATRMARLFILGDLVDSWIGDDDDSELAISLAAQLRQLTEADIAVHFLHGNRDFLIGDAFAKGCGIGLLPERIHIHRARWQLCASHGDELCTSDLAYQKFRQQVRTPAWQTAFLAQPLAARRDFAAKARSHSQQHQQSVDIAITDVDPVAVNQAFAAAYSAPNGAAALLHGHTHRPAIHQSPEGTRIVLGDWRADVGASWLSIDADGLASLHAHGWQQQIRLLANSH